ncbi:Uncharacterised protein [Sebaldella termitidis]|nr:Uncharacterised protein [Sebaldella termitidis]
MNNKKLDMAYKRYKKILLRDILCKKWKLNMKKQKKK